MVFSMALKKMIAPVAQAGSIYFLDCDLRIGLPQVRPIEGITAREAFLSDLHLLDGTERAAKRKNDAIERFKRGDRWFIGIETATGKLTNYRWVTTAWEFIPELERNVAPERGDAFVYGLYTAPEYRRRGIDSFTRQYTYDVLVRTSGITRIVATIFAENYVSLKASRQFLKKIGRVWYLSILGRPPFVLGWPNSKLPPLMRTPRKPAPQAGALQLE